MLYTMIFSKHHAKMLSKNEILRKFRMVSWNDQLCLQKSCLFQSLFVFKSPVILRETGFWSKFQCTICSQTLFRKQNIYEIPNDISKYQQFFQKYVFSNQLLFDKSGILGISVWFPGLSKTSKVVSPVLSSHDIIIFYESSRWNRFREW